MHKISKIGLSSNVRQNCSISPSEQPKLAKSIIYTNTSRTVSPYPNKQSTTICTQSKKTKEKTLRELINDKLKPNVKSQNTIQGKERMSTLRKMLTESSPEKAEVVINRQTQMKKRRTQRQQFEMRQNKLLQLRKTKAEQAMRQREQKQLLLCTFKPKLTPYRW